MDIVWKYQRRKRNGIRYPYSGWNVDILDIEFEIRTNSMYGTDEVVVLKDDLEIDCGPWFVTGDFRCLEEIRDGDLFPFQDISIIGSGRNLDDDEVDVVHSLFI